MDWYQDVSAEQVLDQLGLARASARQRQDKLALNYLVAAKRQLRFDILASVSGQALASAVLANNRIRHAVRLVKARRHEDAYDVIRDAEHAILRMMLA